MRELKFRAFSKEDKKIYKVEGVFINTAGKLAPIFNPYGEVSDEDTSDDFIVIQYTGLKDKNGVEIYEGDIMSLIDGDTVEEIVFDYGTFKLKGVKNITELNGLNINQSGMLIHFKVIGNIYENPELYND